VGRTNIKTDVTGPSRVQAALSLQECLQCGLLIGMIDRVLIKLTTFSVISPVVIKFIGSVSRKADSLLVFYFFHSFLFDDNLFFSF
jgi:hypothetical protein